VLGFIDPAAFLEVEQLVHPIDLDQFAGKLRVVNHRDHSYRTSSLRSNVLLCDCKPILVSPPASPSQLFEHLSERPNFLILRNVTWITPNSSFRMAMSEDMEFRPIHCN